MSQQSYSLTDLADASALEPRTIRSYIERGLLPGAEGRGPKATYSEEHLDRLLAIRRLRDRRRDVSLDEVRLLLQQLTPTQVRQLGQGEIEFALLGEPWGEPDSALAYLQRLKPEMARLGRWSLGKAKPSAVPSDKTALAKVVETLEQLAGQGTLPRTGQSTVWHRIEVTPDIELSIREGFNEEQIRLFQRFADLLRYFLTRSVEPRD